MRQKTKLLIAAMFISCASFGQSQQHLLRGHHIGRSMDIEAYEEYESLSERGKFICDSLENKGIKRLNSDALQYEPHLMGVGKKTKWVWAIRDENITLFRYLFWRDKNGDGFQLKETIVIN